MPARPIASRFTDVARLARAAILFATAGSVALSGGCKSSISQRNDTAAVGSSEPRPGSASGGSGRTMSPAAQAAADAAEPYIASFRAGQYDDALRQAEAMHGAATGERKDRAALMAGLSAYALNRPTTAEGWLNPLTNHKTDEIAGTANLTLGMISLDRKQASKAAPQLQLAAGKLSGDEAAQARLLAGDALTTMRQAEPAREQWREGLTVAQGDAVRSELEGRLAGRSPAVAGNRFVPGRGGSVFASRAATTNAAGPSAGTPTGRFTVQLGAFQDRASADRLAQRAAAAAQRAGQSPPRVVPTTDQKTGRALFAVQIGDFADRASATQVQQAINLGGTVLAKRS